MKSALSLCTLAKQTLEQISKNNAFLSKNTDDSYVFHDLFRDFLQHYAKEYLPTDELYTIRDTSADWLFDDGHFLAGQSCILIIVTMMG